MLARTLAVVGVVGGAVWAVSKYLKSHGGAAPLIDGSDAGKSLSPQDGAGRPASGNASGTASNPARSQTGNH